MHALLLVVDRQRNWWFQLAQAIEDTASIVAHVRKERDVPEAAPNIVIGGSYGACVVILGTR